MITHMQTRSQLQRWLDGHETLRGVKLEELHGGGSYTVRAEAPKGQVWWDGEVHELVESINWPGPAKWKHQLFADLQERMQVGTVRCPEGDACEWCHPRSGGSVTSADEIRVSPRMYEHYLHWLALVWCNTALASPALIVAHARQRRYRWGGAEA